MFLLLCESKCFSISADDSCVCYLQVMAAQQAMYGQLQPAATKVATKSPHQEDLPLSGLQCCTTFHVPPEGLSSLQSPWLPPLPLPHFRRE